MVVPYWFMSSWYGRLRGLTVESVPVDLSDEEYRWFVENFFPSGKLRIPGSLVDKIIDAKNVLKSMKVWVRTDNRSPKDSEFLNFKVKPLITPRECVLALLTSERAYEDMVSMRVKRVWLRKWVEMKAEVRAFIRNQELVAVSQYYYRDYDKFLAKNIHYILPAYLSTIYDAIQRLENLAKSFVLDLAWVKGEPVIVEVNPFSQQTDPCLFTWYELSNPPWKTWKLRFIDLTVKEYPSIKVQGP